MTMKNESGRSMVEMLGVLAIIGVLSIGGIAGYTMAMNRYRANEIIDTASKVAIVAMTSNAGVGASANISNLGSNISVPCIAANTDITSNRYGEVTINVDGSCTGVADVIKTLKGSCTNNVCTLDFGDGTGTTTS
jgi:type II secretory pathway pseudopilin PulG